MWENYSNRPLSTFGLCSMAFHHLTRFQFLPFLSPTQTCYRLEGGSQSWKLHQHCFHLSGCVYKDYDCISRAFTNSHTLGYSYNTSGNDPSHPAWPAPQVEPDGVFSVSHYWLLTVYRHNCWTQAVVTELECGWWSCWGTNMARKNPWQANWTCLQ